MKPQELSAEQEVQAQLLAAKILEKAQQDVLAMARMLVSKPDSELLGATEFDLRDRVHLLGAFALQTALTERKKGATKAQAEAAPIVKRPRASLNTVPKRSPA